MTNPYANTEILQASEPTMIGAVNQTPNLSNNLYADSYPGAPGRTADMSAASGGSDLASRGLSMLSQGDQYGGIMTLLNAEQQSPQSVQNPQFLQQLQLVESQSTSAETTDTSALSAQPQGAGLDSSLPGVSDASALSSQQPATDANAIASQALATAQSDPVSGILGLMKAATMNPTIDQDQNFLATMQEVLPTGQGMAQQSTDAQGNPIAQPGAQQMTDAQGNPSPQPADASQQQSVQEQPTDSSQQQVQTQPVDISQQYAQPQIASSFGIQPGQQLTDTTNNPASADAQIQNAVLQAFQLLQSGDQYDGARLLMMIAKVDPQILQDQVFIKNLQTAEQAAQALQSQTEAAAQSSGAQQLDAQGNPIAQPGTQQMTDAQGNPIPQPGTQQISPAYQPLASTQTMPTDTQTQPQLSMDPSSVGAPTT
jgi:hypothetical protein